MQGDSADSNPRFLVLGPSPKSRFIEELHLTPRPGKI